MHILVTNDDGVAAPGLAALVESLSPVGRVSVIAPDRNWSASGHVKTMHKPLRLERARTTAGTEALATNGAPSDCVAMAVLGVLDSAVDMVVAGINPRANLGHDVTYSGTVTAAMEAAIWGLPAMAVSVVDGEGSGYAAAARVARALVGAIARNGLPRLTLLNVNVPVLSGDQPAVVAITSQSLRTYADRLVRREDPSGRAYYWITGDPPSGAPEPGTDADALAAGKVSITPLGLDLTQPSAAELLRRWRLEVP